MGIVVKTVFVEAHHSIGLVKQYHSPLRHVYTIITNEIPGIDLKLALQIAFKALNNSAVPNGLISTLLVFSAYFWMTEIDASSLTITQHTVAVRKIIDEVRRCMATQQVNDVLNTRSGLSTTHIYDLPPNSQVLVFCKGNIG